MTSAQAYNLRAVLLADLRRRTGLSLADCAKVFRLSSKEIARQHEARARRLWRANGYTCAIPLSIGAPPQA
jgi:hypothetical protein